MGVTVMDNRSYYHHEDLDLTTDHTVTIGNGAYPKNPTDERNANLLYHILIPLFGAIITISNLTVLMSCSLIIKKSNKPKLMYLLLGNIALADALMGVVVIFGQVFPENWRNQQICAAQIGLVASGTLVTVYTGGTIGIDRFLYIFYGYQHQTGFYSKVIQSSVIIVWISSLIIGFLPLMGWSRVPPDPQACCFVVIVPENFILILAILFTLPLTITLVLYSAVLYTASKKVSIHNLLVGKQVSSNVHNRKYQMDKRKIAVESKDSKSSNNILLGLFKKEFSSTVSSSKRWKSIKIVVFSTANFLFTWFPYIIVSLYYMSVCDDDTSKRCKSLSLILASPLAMLGFVSSILSPIIYAWWHKGFNKNFKKRISTFRLRNPSFNKKVVPNTCSNSTMTTILENSNEHITTV
ncbi:5-hydroxytryptamine receptor 7-like isoform X2 [Harmonia axyridis]|uniref:5-hydroxytryptamine receptor 7-like isoform X2 n=1 Tax=Harmonia axyridis TaxID=115357 RepID=UPI001E279659|nr:5-hydroxytryptamine receptor 7-like isoform X2 [Harmonia axyridis]